MAVTRGIQHIFIAAFAAPMGPASYFWLATQLGGASFKRIQRNLSQTCARQAISLYSTDLQLAAMGLSSLRFAKWA